jgi:hypothetical protein
MNYCEVEDYSCLIVMLLNIFYIIYNNKNELFIFPRLFGELVNLRELSENDSITIVNLMNNYISNIFIKFLLTN